MAENNRIIAVLSGKGGTGKTLVSVNLAAAENNSTYVDCDVEEPDGHLFFKPTVTESRAVYVTVPQVDENLCIGCKKCVEFCRFNALAYGKKLMLFEEVCHSCGGCILLCPQKALKERAKQIGEIEIGVSENVKTVTGKMKTGEASGVPIIKNLLSYVKDSSGKIFVDCPPGSACIVMESIADADYCVLVAEPTIFGAHNLEMVYGLVKMFKKPCGAVLNKCANGFNPSENFCRENGIEILAKIPYDKELGALNSDGKLAVRENPAKAEVFYRLLEKISEAVK